MRTIILSLLLLTLSPLAKSQGGTYDLPKLLNENKLTTINRSISIATEENGDYIKVAENKGEGIVWLPLQNSKPGTITVEMRGKDLFQQSFIGIAFHGQNDSTYDAVYCRPFNFFATDSVRKIHAIQYIAHPFYTWKYLRENRNGQYEKAIKNAPKPDEWFVMSIAIKDKTIEVFINHSKQPVLKIEKISQYSKGKIGLFMGDNSGGDFRKISVQ